jgi:Ca2+-binding RTX toxin-like protein
MGYDTGGRRMRRTIGLLFVAAVLVVPVGGLAAQADSATVVKGTSQADVITGMVGPQIIYGRGGDDRINGGKSPDVLYGGRGDDDLTTGKGGATEAAYGGPGDDVLNDFASGQSPGLLVGGRGDDVCIGDKHDTFRRCEVVKFRPHAE